MLELLQPTEAKLLDYKTLSQKNRPTDEKPGVKLVFEMTLANEVLVQFHPTLKPFLFEKSKGAAPSAQKALDGVEPATDAPNLTQAALNIGKLVWHPEMTGYTFKIIRGIGRSESNVPLQDATLSNWRLTPKEGGTVVAKVDVEAGNVDDAAWLAFARLKSRKCEITAKAPEVKQMSVEDKATAEALALEKGIKSSIANTRKPGAAEKAAVAKNGGAPAKGKPDPKGATKAFVDSAKTKPVDKPATH
jgi:hypothetical protein